MNSFEGKRILALIRDGDYALWYATFVDRISRKRAEIKNIGGADWHNFVLSMYSVLHGVIADGALGGAIVHARAD